MRVRLVSGVSGTPTNFDDDPREQGAREAVEQGDEADER